MSKRKARKKAVNSKQKGAKFERDCCQRLSLWISDLKRDDLFWRSSMSGGRATLKSRKGRAKAISSHAGDIMATHLLGHPFLDVFYCECKWYADFNAQRPVFGRRGNLLAFWQETQEQAQRYDRIPLFFGKQNRQPEILITDSDGWAVLQQGVDDPWEFTCHAIFPTHDAFVFHFRDLLTGVEPSRLPL